jgi:outer membrane protein
MSTHIRALAFVLALLAIVAAPAAQAQKIGYTNQEAILANMPEMQDVQQQLQQEYQRQQQELQREQQAFQERVQRYQRQQSLLSDSVRTQRERELQQRQAELQQALQQREQQLQQREMELMQPLFEELQTAIEDVAASQSVDVVLRAQSMLWVDTNSSNVVDITPDVAQQLGIDISGAETQPSPSVEDAASPVPPEGGGQ